MLKQARRLLQEGRRKEALRLYEEFLKTHDDDLETWLEFGLACLLDNDRDRFLQVHAMFAHCMSPAVLSGVGRRARRLWDEYSRACSRFAAAAAVGTVMMLPGGFAGCKGTVRPPDVETETEVAAVDMVHESEEAGLPDVQEPEADAADEAGLVEDAAADAAVSKKDKGKKKNGPPKYKTRYIAVHHLDDEDLGQ